QVHVDVGAERGPPFIQREIAAQAERGPDLVGTLRRDLRPEERAPVEEMPQARPRRAQWSHELVLRIETPLVYLRCRDRGLHVDVHTGGAEVVPVVPAQYHGLHGIAESQ